MPGLAYTYLFKHKNLTYSYCLLFIQEYIFINILQENVLKTSSRYLEPMSHPRIRDSMETRWWSYILSNQIGLPSKNTIRTKTKSGVCRNYPLARVHQKMSGLGTSQDTHHQS